MRKNVTKGSLIADILQTYKKVGGKMFKKPAVVYTENQLKRMTRGELQLLLAEMVLS